MNICTKCKLNKPSESFYKSGSRSNGAKKRYWCIECVSQWQKLNLQKIKSDPVKYEQHRKLRTLNSKKWRSADPERSRHSVKLYQRERKIKALEHYSGGIPMCNCCGEKEQKFLSIDHINNDGNRHRRADPSAIAIYAWLKKNGYPKGFQVLCFNCNLSKAFFGSCPHKKV